MKNDSTELHFFAEVNSLYQRRRALILLLMRTSAINFVFILSCTCMAYSIPAKGQNIESTNVNLVHNRATIKTVFAAIEEQTDFSFVVPTHKINTAKYKVSLEARTYTVKDALDLVLKDTGIRYEQNGNFIYISLANTRKDSPVEMKNPEVKGKQLESRTAALIKGTVKDAIAQEPLAGVNIIVKGTTKGTTTDVEGKFAIEAEENDVLVFSFIGYKSFEATIGGRSNIDVLMDVDVTALKEIEVNAGYWKVAERERTGNISKITAEEIRNQPVTNPLQALQGRVAGVYIEQFTGLPGGGFRVRIRGQNSLRPEANEPLYIVDGVPFTSTTLHSGIAISANSQLESPNPLNSLNPNDIESIEILKDADATAIYGSRGSNGVILITTKRAKTDKTKLDFSFSSGIGKVPKMLDLLNTQQWMEMRNEAFKNDGTIPKPYDNDMNGNWDTTRYTNWQKVLIGGTAKYTNAQIAISGGNEQTQFTFGTNYYKETTVYPGNSSYQRGSSHVNLKHTSINKKVSFDILMNYSTDKNSLPQSDLTTFANELQPVAPPVFNERGELNWQNGTWTNPYSTLFMEYEGKTELLHSNSIFTYRPIDGLSVKANLAYISMNMREISLQPKKAADPLSMPTAISRFGQSHDKKITIEPQIDYTRNIGNGKINISAGGTYLQSKFENLQFLGIGYTNDALIKSLAAASTKIVIESPFTEYKYVSAFARLNYVLKEKYILNVTGRKDGSSRFGPNKQFGYFGAVGAAWIFSDEMFIQKNLKFLSFGKIRSSYGSTGNDQIPDYGFLDTYSPTSSYKGVAGLIPTRLVNTDYSWEVTKKFEAAIEIGILSNRILVSTSYYNNRSSNQLVGLPLPLITGRSSIQSNLPAEIENKGWEVELSSNILQKHDLVWSISANVTFPKSLLISYPNIESSPHANQYTLGKSLNLKKTLDFTGVDPTTGTPTFLDVDQDSNISVPNDLLAINNIDRKFYGGLNNSFSFKGITLAVFVQVVKQNNYNYLRTFRTNPGAGSSNQPTIVMNRWRESGDVTDIPKFMNITPNYFNLSNSDFSITDASFVRIKNVSISWNLPSFIVQKIKADSAKIFVQGQNLFTFSSYLGRDPEIGFSSSLPALRVLTAGVNISL